MRRFHRRPDLVRYSKIRRICQGFECFDHMVSPLITLFTCPLGVPRIPLEGYNCCHNPDGAIGAVITYYKFPSSIYKSNIPPSSSRFSSQRRRFAFSARFEAEAELQKPSCLPENPDLLDYQQRLLVQKKKEGRGSPLNFKTGSATCSPSPRGGEKAPSPPPVVKGRGRSPRRRKRGGSRAGRARAAAAARERSTSASDSRCSESASPEHKRHAAIAVVDDDSSSSTTVEDSEMDAGSPTPCDLC
ncbi:hypothetical protein HPB51_002277 [Rhipicephalus microplus]|uniref:Uncharacterized protein n=1 Tax=Rhipicephalus microplus TaxID=6941 RepID=A0A9J6DY13_RHIMP|nr:hypothetical protein HPB51_002277 [Rhipicephalus microplus]